MARSKPAPDLAKRFVAENRRLARFRQLIKRHLLWDIEPNFRDTKDPRFGMGMSALRIADPQRRDRLFLLNAFAIVLLTLLGVAGESLGMDRHLRSNTSKRRTHSLFRQGCLLRSDPQHARNAVEAAD
jgi:hypothetical protein